MGDTQKQPRPPRPPAVRPSADQLREEQAIAAAMLIGEQMHHADRTHVFWYAKRVGFLVAGFAVFMLLMLFAMWRVRPEFNPTGWMLAMAALAAGGIAAVYWAYAENKRHRDQ